MYIFPGYVRYYEENEAIYVSSKLLQNEIMITDTAIKKEFRELLNRGGCLELSTPLTQFLHEQKLLPDNCEIRFALIEAEKVLNNIMSLTIMPTEGCNFRCPYCYEDHSPVSMRRETLDRIQEYIAEKAPHFQRVLISWFGGEPTLCKDVILETNELAQSLQSKYGFHFTSAMTTNGYLLSAEHFQEYFAAGISRYQITLDGWDHDKTRPHVSGQGTLQTILNNLLELTALPADEYPFQIILRRNLLAGDMDFTWYDRLKELFGWDNRFFVAVLPVSDCGGETVKNLILPHEEDINELLSAHIAYVKKLGLQLNSQPDAYFSNVCAASYPYGFLFRADGRIEKCATALNHPKNQVGYVDPDKGVILDDAVNRLWSPNDFKAECCVCPDVLTCLNLACRKGVIIDGRVNAVCPHEIFGAICL